MFRLSVVTPEKVVYDEDVVSIIAPGGLGYLGIMSNHAPIISSIKPGKLTVKDGSGNEINLALSGGFLENSGNKCTILADSAEFAADLDLERAKESLERARQRVRNAAGEIDTGRAQAALERARNRITIVEKRK
ncbi:MAG: F0F1 ATP synthase subunit epsilon [FCB group bacterium]|nr:F0F1 ATP synthase subunit epsilon [FCB group bacterium]